MQFKTAFFLIIGLIAVTSCSQRSTDSAISVSTSVLTQDVAETTTAMMAEVINEFMDGLTATANLEKAVEEALTTAVAAAIAETLTAVPPTPFNSPQPTVLVTSTPLKSPLPLLSETPTSLPTLTLPPLLTATKPQICYHVIDSWCNSHQGCSTVDVRNQSGLDSTWHIWTQDNSIDVTFTIPPGFCTLVTRPGKYNFNITYCAGEVANFAWQLNDNWWYKISPCN